MSLLKQNKRVLLLTPYMISKKEYLANSTIKNGIKYIDDNPKKEIDIDASNFVVMYPALIVDEISKTLKKNVSDFQKEQTEYISIDILKYFRLAVTHFINSFDLVIIDEIDMLEIQGEMVKKTVALEIDDRRFTKFDTLIAILMIIAKSNTETIAVSANKFPEIPRLVQNEASFLSGIAESFSNLINYYDTELKSNQNISEFIIISVNSEKIPYSMVQEMLIRGGKDSNKNKTIIFSAKKWNCNSLKAGVENKGIIYVRENNIGQKHDEIKKTPVYKCMLDGYEYLMLIDLGYNLEESTFTNNSLAMINLSSSRAVSINSQFKEKSVSIAFSDVVNPGVTQSFGRFRNNLTQLILVGNNLNKETVMEQFKETDPYLYEEVKDKTIFIEADGMANINRHKIIERKLQTEVSKGKAIGQNISQKTIDKKQSITDFAKTIDIKKYQTKVQLLNDYLSYCSDNDLTPVSKNTLFKELPLPTKEEIALYNATYFKTKTYNNGAEYKDIDEWFMFYKKYCKKNKLVITTKEIFINIKVE